MQRLQSLRACSGPRPFQDYGRDFEAIGHERRHRLRERCHTRLWVPSSLRASGCRSSGTSSSSCVDDSSLESSACEDAKARAALELRSRAACAAAPAPEATRAAMEALIWA